MRKKIPQPQVTAYSHIEICDVCGRESEQDDILVYEELMGMTLALHRNCKKVMRNKIRKSFGLLEEE